MPAHLEVFNSDHPGQIDDSCLVTTPTTGDIGPDQEDRGSVPRTKRNNKGTAPSRRHNDELVRNHVS